jgi:hypothetical protein
MCSPLPSRSFFRAGAASWSLFQVISPFLLLCSLLWSSGTRAEILSLETLLTSDGKINVPAYFRGLIDFSGRVVHESLLNCGPNELALMNLPSGIYWMEADLNGEILRAKVVKK